LSTIRDDVFHGGTELVCFLGSKLMIPRQFRTPHGDVQYVSVVLPPLLALVDFQSRIHC